MRKEGFGYLRRFLASMTFMIWLLLALVFSLAALAGQAVTYDASRVLVHGSLPFNHLTARPPASATFITDISVRSNSERAFLRRSSR